MFEKLGLVFIAICASPLMVLLLAFMAIYVPLYGLIKLFTNSHENTIESSGTGNNKLLSTLRVKHA